MKYFLRHHYAKRIARPKQAFRPKLKQKSASTRSFPSATPAGLAAQQQVKWYPLDVSTKEEKALYETFRLRPAGEWTIDMTNGLGNNFLAQQHWNHVKEFIKKHPPPTSRTQKEMENWYRQAILTPEQKVVMYSEASFLGPLNHKGFLQFMEAFEQVVGKKQFEALHHGMSPKQLTKAAEKQEKMLLNQGLIEKDAISEGLETPYQKEQRRLREWLDKHPGPFDNWSDFTNKSELGHHIKEKRLEAERESRKYE